jgi:hypothetical protein
VKLIRLVKGEALEIVGGRGQVHFKCGGNSIREIPIEMLREAIDKLDSNKILVKAERLVILYKAVLRKARGDQFLLVNREKYLALQGVAWEGIQEINQELPHIADLDMVNKLRALLMRVEDSNHRLDAILATRYAIMNDPICNEIRSHIKGGELPGFLKEGES